MLHPIVAIACLSALTAAAWAADVRVLYDFEDPAELAGLRAGSENVSVDLSQDNGVTRGRSCARVVFAEGEGWGTLVLGADRIGDWSGYAAVAFDVVQERGDKWPVNVELWDGASRDYHTRFTTETLVRPGRNTVVVPIDRARRNGKEGRDWNELEPQDRIDLGRLTQVKIFINSPRSGGDLVWWVDNVRLLTESALAGPPIHVDLPAGAQ
ncbi:MAG: hypothetical protein H0X45_06400, partial [Planctomycetes bacterium]|nr:hypothetical protein [Planctomycetota bacterium]